MQQRIIAGLSLAAGLAKSGFVGFAMLALTLASPLDSYFAISVIVVIASLLGIAAGLGIAAILAWKLPERALTPAGIFGLLLAIGVFAFIIWDDA